MDVETSTICVDDRSLVQTVISGDTEASRALVERNQEKLYGVIMRLVCDPVLADEFAQDTFVKAFTHLRGFRGDSSFGTWLIQIGINTVREYQRRTQREAARGIISLEAQLDVRDKSREPLDDRSFANPQAEMDENQCGSLIGEGTRRIPLEYREVLVLKHFGGWPYERISRVTGVSIGTLKARAHLARKLLKNQLTALDPEFGSERAPYAGPKTKSDGKVGHGRAD